VSSPAEKSREILELCRELGFALAGITRAAPSRDEDVLRRWLAAGKQGTMEYLTQFVDVRVDVRQLLVTAKFEHSADACSVIMVADQYASRNAVGREEPLEGRGRIARYARGRNYHEVMKDRLHDMADELRRRYRGTTFCSFVDTAPVLERELAARCGLGWAAKNTMLIHPKRGSYLLLGGAVTSMDLAPMTPEGVEEEETERRRDAETEGGDGRGKMGDDAASRGPVADFCGTCTRCIDACPTRAITPYEVDASRCISYLTIERRVAIPTEFHAAMGDWIAGCDVCQEVCPHNSPRPVPQADDVVRKEYEPRQERLDLRAILGWTEADRREAFKVSALKRINLAMIRRNAIVALGNEHARTRDGTIGSLLAGIAADEREDEMVRQTAREVLAALAGR
jgi:epoxyqueuosine reductase